MIEILNYSSVIGGIILLFILYKHLSENLIYILPNYLVNMWYLLSCLYIETQEPYIFEQGISGYETGGTFRLFLYVLVFYLGVLLAYRILPSVKIHVQNLSNKKRMYTLLLWTFFSINIVMVLHVLYSGSPLLKMLSGDLTASRFDFWETSAQIPILSIIDNWLPMFNLLLGYFYVNLRDSTIRRVLGLNIFLLMVYYALLGNKFTPFYMFLLYFSIPVFSYTGVEVQSLKKQIGKIAIFLMVMAGISIAMYYSVFAIGDRSIWESIIYRVFGLQGHLWWGIDTLVFNEHGYDYNQIYREITAFFYPTEDHIEVGHRALMLLVGGKLAAGYIEQNINFTGGFQALLIYTFGPYLSFFVIFLLGTLYTSVINIIKWCIKTNDLFMIILGFKLYTAVYYFLSMGETVVLFNYKNCFYIGILFLYGVIRRYIVI